MLVHLNISHLLYYYYYSLDNKESHQARAFRTHPWVVNPQTHDPTRWNHVSGNLVEPSSGDQTEDV